MSKSFFHILEFWIKQIVAIIGNKMKGVSMFFFHLTTRFWQHMYELKTLRNWFSWINERVAQKTLKIVKEHYAKTLQNNCKRAWCKKLWNLDTSILYPQGKYRVKSKCITCKCWSLYSILKLKLTFNLLDTHISVFIFKIYRLFMWQLGLYRTCCSHDITNISYLSHQICEIWKLGDFFFLN